MSRDLLGYQQDGIAIKRGAQEEGRARVRKKEKKEQRREMREGLSKDREERGKEAKEREDR